MNTTRPRPRRACSHVPRSQRRSCSRPASGVRSSSSAASGSRVRAPRKRPPLQRRDRLQRLNRLIEALELELPARLERDAVEVPAGLGDGRGREDLSPRRLRAQPRRQVQHPAAIAVLDRHRLAVVDADPDRQWKIGVRRRLLGARLLELESCANGLRRGLEHGDELVSPQPEDFPSASFDDVIRQVRKRHGEAGSGLVATLSGKRRIARGCRR